MKKKKVKSDSFVRSHKEKTREKKKKRERKRHQIGWIREEKESRSHTWLQLQGIIMKSMYFIFFFPKDTKVQKQAALKELSIS